MKEKLDFNTTLDLEIFLVESISLNVIDAVLFGEEQLVKVKSSRGRDVLLDQEPDKQVLQERYKARTVSSMVESLKAFSARVDKSLDYLQAITADDKEDEPPQATDGDEADTEASKASENITNDETLDTEVQDAAEQAADDGKDTSMSAADSSTSSTTSRKRKID